MTQDRFLKMLERPELLNSVTYEELKTLVLAYPYTHNLRYLLAVKAKQENHSEFAKNLATASAYSLDRKRLFQILAPKQIAPKPTEEKVAVLELKPIEKVREELEAKVPVAIEPQKKEEAKNFVAAPPPPIPEIPGPPKIRQKDVLFDFSETVRQKMEALENAKTAALVEKQPEKPADPERLAAMAGPEKEETLEIEIAVGPEKAEISEKPAPDLVPFNETPILVFAQNQTAQIPDLKPDFQNWLGQFSLPMMLGQNPGAKKSNLSPLDFFQKPEFFEEEKLRPAGKMFEKPSEKSEARMLAEKSVIENQDLVSETLARLYVRQGYHEKAILMYQKLGLAIPEKSHFFAAEIEKLKKQ